MILTKTPSPTRVESYSEELYADMGTLNLYAETANVRIEAHSWQRVDVEAELRDVDLRVWQEDGNVMVYAENRKPPASEMPVNPKANIVINVPADCELYAQVVTGALSVRDISAPLRSYVITGKTTLENVLGRISAECVTGAIHFRGRLVDGAHRFMSTTGAVHLVLDELPNARIYAWATTGRVNCALPLSESRRGGYLTGDHLYGVAGAGEGRVLAEVVTGSIHIERSAPSTQVDEDINRFN